MGIGSDFQRGGQVDWVLGRFSSDEEKILQPTIDIALELIKSFVLAGINITMNQFNQLGKHTSSSQSPIEKRINNISNDR